MAVSDTNYGASLGVRLLTELAESGHFVFTMDEARVPARRLGVSESYLRQLLSRLAESGWITRLKRGTYAASGRLPGAEDPHPFVVSNHLVSPSAVSHWSAWQHHGLTTQLPLVVTATTPKKVVTPSMRVGPPRGTNNFPSHHTWDLGGLRFEYVTVRPERFFGLADVWIDEQSRASITDLERSILDGFISPRTFGGMGEVLGAIGEQLNRLDVDKLIGYAVRINSSAVARRLGWTLEHLGVTAARLEELASFAGPGYRVLDPCRSGRGPRDTRWRTVNNLSAEPGPPDRKLVE